MKTERRIDTCTSHKSFFWKILHRSYSVHDAGISPASALRTISEKARSKCIDMCDLVIYVQTQRIYSNTCLYNDIHWIRS